MTAAIRQGVGCAWRFLSNLRLYQKLLISYLLLIMLPLGGLTLISYYSVQSVLEDRILHSATYAFDRTWEFSTYLVNRVIRTSDAVALDTTINDALEKDRASYTLPDQYKDMNALRLYLRSFSDPDDGLRLRLYLQDELVYSLDDDTLIALSEARKQPWYASLQATTDSLMFCTADGLGEEGAVLSLLRELRWSDDYQVTLAYLRVDFSAERVKAILSQANPTEGSLTYLVNSRDTLVAASDGALTEVYAEDYRALRPLLGADGWTLTTLAGESAFQMARTVPGSDWIIATVIPTHEIYSEIVALRNAMLIMLFGIGTASFLIAAYVSLSITRPIARLAAKMKAVQSGDLSDVTIPMEGKDEIGELTQDYNFMIQRIIALVNDQKRAGMELKSAELRALQAQINPHFLYNTLDMINWMSYANRSAEIRTLVKALSAFYKLSLNQGREIVPLKDELDHVQMYMRIQNIRLEQRVRFAVDVDEAYMHYGIIKITLQPIVENAIVHGIANTRDKRGSIIIRGRVQDDMLLLAVCDDGCGMTPERLRQVFDGALERRRTNSFGIRNIHDRICLAYGPRYGLQIESEVGKGTEVRIRLPRIAKLPEDLPEDAQAL